MSKALLSLAVCLVAVSASTAAPRLKDKAPTPVAEEGDVCLITYNFGDYRPWEATMRRIPHDYGVISYQNQLAFFWPDDEGGEAFSLASGCKIIRVVRKAGK